MCSIPIGAASAALHGDNFTIVRPTYKLNNSTGERQIVHIYFYSYR